MGLIRFGTFTEDALERDTALVSGLSGVFEKMDMGDNIYRFLPPPVGKDTPFRTTALHYIDGPPGSNRKIVFACPKHELKQPCPACAKVEELAKSANPNMRKLADDMRASLRMMANVINRKVPQVGTRILPFGSMIFDGLKAIRKRGDDFTNPYANGFDVIITKTDVKGQGVRYTVTPARTSSPLAATEEEMQALIDSQHDLDSHVTTAVPEELEAVWASLGGNIPSYTRGAAGMQLPPQGGVRVGQALMTGAQPAPTPAVAPAPAAGTVIETQATAVSDAAAVAPQLDDDFNEI